MTKQLHTRRCAVFTAGLFFAALGVSLITKAGLGTSPVTSLSYALTFILPLSLGALVFAVNLLYLAGQAILLRRRFPLFQLLQAPAVLLFSALIDFWMLLFSRWGEGAPYAARIAVLLLGCVSLGLGVALEVMADVLILPAEGIVKVISQELHKEFGNVKTLFDLALVSSAALVSLLCLGQVAGIREGTLIAAVTVGSISRFFRKRLSFLVREPAPAPPLPAGTDSLL